MSCNARYFHFICMHFAVESRTNALNCASHCVCDVGAAHCVYAAWRCLMERPSSLPHQQVAGAGHANTMPWNMLESAIHGLESPFPFHFPFPAQRCVAYGKCALHSNKTHRVALLCCRLAWGRVRSPPEGFIYFPIPCGRCKSQSHPFPIEIILTLCRATKSFRSRHLLS